VAYLKEAARGLESRALGRYLEVRERDLVTAWESLRGGLGSLRGLARSLR